MAPGAKGGGGIAPLEDPEAGWVERDTAFTRRERASIPTLKEIATQRGR